MKNDGLFAQTRATLLIAIAIGSLATAPVDAQDLDFGAGSGWCDGTELCLDPDQLISTYRLTISTEEYGFSASYEDECWPWPEPPPGSGGQDLRFAPSLAAARGVAQQQQPIARRHGSAVQIVGEIYPLALFNIDVGISRYLRPFLGAGIHASRDGDPSADGPGDSVVYGIAGRIDPLIAYGATLYLPSRASRFRGFVQLRGNTIFTGEIVYRRPLGPPLTAPGETITWAQVTAGMSVRIGL